MLNVKNDLDFAFRHMSNSFTFYITVEEYWSKGTSAGACSIGTLLNCLHCLSVTFHVHVALN